jgi:hypothetical protein
MESHVADGEALVVRGALRREELGGPCNCASATRRANCLGGRLRLAARKLALLALGDLVPELGRRACETGA